MLPRGTDNIADAPTIGFGVSIPTPNANLNPVSYNETPEVPHGRVDEYFTSDPIQTAWWKFVAPKDCWVSFDLHRSTANFPTFDDQGPETTLMVCIGEPGNLWPLIGTTTSYPVDDRTPPTSDEWAGLQYNWVNTSEVLLLVDEGATYYVQAGMSEDRLTWAPNSPDLVNYVLTVREMTPHPVEIVVSVQNLHNSPNGITQVPGPPIIVGGDTALRRDTPGYVDLPVGGARLGFTIEGAVGHDAWPPPSYARVPDGGVGVQIFPRWEVERLSDDNSTYYGGNPGWDGNMNDEYDFTMNNYADPNLGGQLYWDPNGDPQYPAGEDPPLAVGEWLRDDDTRTRGVLTHVGGGSPEDFAAYGEYRLPELYDRNDPPLVQAAKYYNWNGAWSSAPFRREFHHAGPTEVSPGAIDYTIWFGGYPVGTGMPLAIHAAGLRIHWMEWLIRWITWTPATGEIAGSQTGDARAFSDG